MLAHSSQLLLVIHRNVRNFLALRIRCGGCGSVRVLPSFETTMRPVSVALPPFLFVSVNVFLWITS